ncbi:MAG: hypothetical protein MI861_27235, partial [Pirellulales bacterium]|nr:hypothetical protein [Pirellulales bacterium]
MSGFSSRTIKRLLQSQLGPLFALLLIILFFAAADRIWSGGHFLSIRNARVMLDATALIAVPALGMTIIIIAAGIDLSAGTALTLCGTVLALQLKNSELNNQDEGFWWVMTCALAATVLTGCLCGLANGVLISVTKVVPFVVTLGTMTIFLGIGQILADESTVHAPKENIPNWLNYLCHTGPNPD